MRSDKSRRRFVFLCVAPATILFFLFMILPTLNVFRMSPVSYTHLTLPTTERV